MSDYEFDPRDNTVKCAECFARVQDVPYEVTECACGTVLCMGCCAQHKEECSACVSRGGGMSPTPELTTSELVDLALAEIQAASDDYARNFLRRMTDGEVPSEWDFTAAEMAADIAVLLDDFQKAKK